MSLGSFYRKELGDMKTLTSEMDRLKKEQVENEKRASEYTGPRKVFTHLGKEKDVTAPWISDEEVAGRVRMLMRDDMDHESVCVLARDRILHLSQYMKERHSLLTHETPMGYGVSLVMRGPDGETTGGFVLMSSKDKDERDKYANDLAKEMELGIRDLGD